MGIKGKAFSEMSRDELESSIDQKKAYPDMVLKRMFFTFQETMTRSEQELMMNWYKNQGVYNDNDIYRFRTSILGLFRLISGMIYDAQVFEWTPNKAPLVLRRYGVNSDYELCIKLTQYAQLDVSALIHLAGYLNYCLHELGLTDLLVDNPNKEFDFNDVI